MSTLRRLALVTTLATYLLISVGALVRASGAGLGCPDWPRCYGRWIPPTQAEEVSAAFVDDFYDGDEARMRADFNARLTWTEYANRLVGVVIGLLVLGTAIAALRHWRRARGGARSGQLAKLAVGSLLLVGFQGWLGGKVVSAELAPRMVTLHFLVAVVIVWLLCFLCLQSLADRFPLLEERGAADRRLRRWTLLSLVVATAQLLLGTVVRGGVDVEMAARPDDARSSWLEAVGWVDLLHRDLAIGVLGLMVVLVLLARKAWEGRPLLRGVVVLNGGVVVAQIVAGLILAYASLPPVAQIVHVSLGTWLVGGLHLQWLLSARAERPAPVAQGAPA